MEIRRAAARERVARSRAAETREARARRLEADRDRHVQARAAESSEHRAHRQEANRERMARARRVNPNPVGQQSQEILVGSVAIQDLAESSHSIGTMNMVFHHCGALKFKAEEAAVVMGR